MSEVAGIMARKADNGDNILFGTSGDDSISGLGGNDTINGLGGNDRLYGDSGDDTFVFSKNFGQDRVSDSAGTGDTIRFDSSVVPSDVRLAGDSFGNLYLYDDAHASSVYIGNQLRTATIEWLQFGASSRTSLAGGLNMTGSAAADSIYGSKFNDTINGLGGNDRLYGDSGDDTFVFSKNFGQDRVSDSAGHNTIQLSGLSAAQITLSRSYDDLQINVKGTQNEIVVNNYYEHAGDWTLLFG